LATLAAVAAALVVGLAAGLPACFVDAGAALAAPLLAGVGFAVSFFAASFLAGTAVGFFGWGSAAAVRWPLSAISDANANARVVGTWFLGIVVLFPLSGGRARVRVGRAADLR
jgi:hypothetical protein